MSLAALMVHRFDHFTTSYSKDASAGRVRTYTLANAQVPCTFQPDVSTEASFPQEDETQRGSVYLTNATVYNAIEVEHCLRVAGANYEVKGKQDACGLARVFKVTVEQMNDDEVLTATQTVAVSGGVRAGGNAVGGEEDVTADIQALINAGGNVVIPPGVHTVRALTVPNNVISIRGAGGEAGCILRLANESPDFTRILNVRPNQSTNYAIEIYDLSFDMNRDNQNWIVDSFNLAHQAAILLHQQGSGFLDADIHDVTIYDSAGDGIYVYHRVRCDITDFTCTDVFRAGLGITGRASITNATNSTFVRSGIDVEPNSLNDNVTATFDEITCHDWDIALKPGGNVTASNIHHTGGVLYLFVADGATFNCTDSEFIGRYRIRLPGESTFENCTFTAPDGNTTQIVGVSWAYHSWTSNQTLTFEDCEFIGPGAWAINANADTLGNNNTLVLTNNTAEDTTTLAVATKTDHRNYSGNTLDGNPWP